MPAIDASRRRLHVVMVAEPSRRYSNMAALLLYSLRRNGGVLKDAPVTLVVNGTSLEPDVVDFLTGRFAPLRIRVMPRMPGPIFGSKFNALYCLDDDEWDAMVYLDCDMIVCNDMAEVVDGMGGAGFAAIPAGKQAFHRYRDVLLACTGMSPEELGQVRNDRFWTEYPLFHGGMYVVSRTAVNRIRRDAVRICYELYDRRYTSPKEFFRFTYNDRLLNPRHARSIARRLPIGILRPIGTYYPLWCTEQIALAAAILKNHVPHRTLDTRCAWNNPDYPDAHNPPPLFHYMRGLYPIDRDHLFAAAWVDQYRNDSAKMKRSLGELAFAFRRDNPKALP